MWKIEALEADVKRLDDDILLLSSLDGEDHVSEIDRIGTELVARLEELGCKGVDLDVDCDFDMSARSVSL